ncbi:unnamed protein product [Symbiodinium necroappetens]|uniref:Cyclic nucleotide-binding domain-containing protein n=1 Tax=Symbiodinium necroappetens TaxID=1628268 RepID=A0A812R9Y1_9DINO|nr:unnamed protein product [Symbiodinium necroappetens]
MTALQRCEEVILGQDYQAGKLPESERSLEELLLDYVEGFGRSAASQQAEAATATRLASSFLRRELQPRQILFRADDAADSIFVVARGSLRTCTNREWVGRLGDATALLASPPTLPIGADSWVRSETPPIADFDDFDGEHELVGVGSILNDTAFYARRKCGVNAAAQAGLSF